MISLAKLVTQEDSTGEEEIVLIMMTKFIQEENLIHMLIQTLILIVMVFLEQIQKQEMLMNKISAQLQVQTEWELLLLGILQELILKFHHHG